MVVETSEKASNLADTTLMYVGTAVNMLLAAQMYISSWDRTVWSDSWFPKILCEVTAAPLRTHVLPTGFA